MEEKRPLVTHLVVAGTRGQSVDLGVLLRDDRHEVVVTAVRAARILGAS